MFICGKTNLNFEVKAYKLQKWKKKENCLAPSEKQDKQLEENKKLLSILIVASWPVVMKYLKSPENNQQNDTADFNELAGLISVTACTVCSISNTKHYFMKSNSHKRLT